jgi:hypothetical protein
VLTLLAQDRVNVGRLHLEGRRAGARIGELVDAEATRPRRSPAKNSAKESAKPMPTRTKTARSARTGTANARTTTES